MFGLMVALLGPAGDVGQYGLMPAQFDRLSEAEAEAAALEASIQADLDGDDACQGVRVRVLVTRQRS